MLLSFCVAAYRVFLLMRTVAAFPHSFLTKNVLIKKIPKVHFRNAGFSTHGLCLFTLKSGCCIYLFDCLLKIFRLLLCPITT